MQRRETIGTGPGCRDRNTLGNDNQLRRNGAKGRVGTIDAASGVLKLEIEPDNGTRSHQRAHLHLNHLNGPNGAAAGHPVDHQGVRTPDGGQEGKREPKDCGAQAVTAFESTDPPGRKTRCLQGQHTGVPQDPSAQDVRLGKPRKEAHTKHGGG